MSVRMVQSDLHAPQRCGLQKKRAVALASPGLSAALLFCALVGCVHDPQIAPVVETVAALTADVQRVEAGVGDIAARIARVDQSVNNYDEWTLRIQAIAPWLLLALPLPYVLGKIVWVATGKVTYAAKQRRFTRRTARRNRTSRERA